MLRTALLAAALAAGGCYAVEADYPGGTEVGLTFVAPGVEVVTNFDEPVFFVDGFYWRWYSGYWYQSAWWDRGWEYRPAPPVALHNVARPWTYRHYRPAPGHQAATADPGGAKNTACVPTR